MDYAFTSSINGNEKIKIHFCDMTAKTWKHIVIETSTFDEEDKKLYDALDLPDFGKHYCEKHNVRYVKNENK